MRNGCTNTSARKSQGRRRAFTLVEVLIVVTVLAILAGVVVPQVTGVLDEVKQSTMLHDLRELTMAIERYRIDHDGATPDLIERDTLIQLVSKTDVEGNVGNGPQHVYGPYLPRIGPNPLNGVSRVFRVNTSPPDNLSNRVGWVYHPPTGQIWAGLYAENVDLLRLEAQQ